MTSFKGAILRWTFLTLLAGGAAVAGCNESSSGASGATDAGLTADAAADGGGPDSSAREADANGEPADGATADAKLDATADADAASQTTIGSCVFAPNTYTTNLGGSPATMTLKVDGTLSASFAGGLATVTSDWTLTTTTLTLNDTGGNAACPNAQTGIYTIAFTSDCAKFTMTAVSDPCTNGGSGAPHRKELLDGSTWTKQ
ncbi:MAG: hypothetical protein NVS3B10_03980 [Polyangiales bacterium]